jgi:predicted metal-dependent phosphoesterase TrpH
MIKLIDLHTHSTASDGSMEPGELVKYAKSRGLAAIALTDHDTMEGIKEAYEEGLRIDFEVVPGLEISVDFEPEMHILGYFSGDSYLDIEDTLIYLRKSREERNPKIIKKLNDMGFDINMEEVSKVAVRGVVGRAHIAKVLADKGYVGSVGEAFDKFLSSGRPAFVKRDKFTPEQGINEITRAGGIPVLAHPIYLDRSYAELDSLFYELKIIGLKGIEAYYVDNTPQDTANMVKLAHKHGLLISGGSDFHGSFKSDIEIGVGYGNLNIPYDLLEKLKKASAQQNTIL